MNTIRKIALSTIAAAISVTAVFAKPIPGPKGGRILNTEAPYAEFFVEKDHTATVTFYDKALKPIAVDGRVVSLIAEAKSGKARLDFSEKNNALESTTALPAGDDYNVVIQVRENAAAKPKNYRVYYEADLCGECHRPEYACICDDAGTEKKPEKTEPWGLRETH